MKGAISRGAATAGKPPASLDTRPGAPRGPAPPILPVHSAHQGDALGGAPHPALLRGGPLPVSAWRVGASCPGAGRTLGCIPAQPRPLCVPPTWNHHAVPLPLTMPQRRKFCRLLFVDRDTEAWKPLCWVSYLTSLLATHNAGHSGQEAGFGLTWLWGIQSMVR